MALSLYHSTEQRLVSYGVFTPAVIDQIATLAQHQGTFRTYRDFFTSTGVGEPFVYTVKNGDGVSVIDIPARDTQEGVLVVHTSMATPLDASQLYQLATLAAANSTYRIIGFGNPAGGVQYIKAQELNFWRRFKVAVFRDMSPVVAPELAYLKEQSLTRWYQIGFSYGALKATAESEYMDPGSLQGLLLLDPVPFTRSVIRLVLDFKRTYGPLGKYVNRVNLQTYHDARGDAAEGFGKNALLRPINIAIAVALSRNAIYERITRVMNMQPRAKIAIAWGSKSELGDELRTRRSIAAINQGGVLKDRVQSFRLEGAEHAFVNDIHLYAAIVKQFLVKN